MRDLIGESASAMDEMGKDKMEHFIILWYLYSKDESEAMKLLQLQKVKMVVTWLRFKHTI